MLIFARGGANRVPWVGGVCLTELVQRPFVWKMHLCFVSGVGDEDGSGNDCDECVNGMMALLTIRLAGCW